MNIEELKKRMESAKVINGGNYLNPNSRGRVVIKCTKLQSGYKGQAGIIEFEVEESEGGGERPGIAAGKAHKRGDDANAVFKLSGGGVKEDMGFNNLKTAMVAILGSIKGKQEDLGGLIAACFPDTGRSSDACRGVVLNYATDDRAAKDGKEARSFARFSPASDNSEAEIAARTAELDKRKPL